MDSECDLDMPLPLVTPPPPSHQWTPSTQFYIKIYKNGKVYIKRFGVATHNSASAPSRESIILAPCTTEDISTSDGIRFPPYFISMLKNVFRDGPNMKAIHSFESCLNIFESIKIFQEEMVKAHKSMPPMDKYWFEKGHMAQINRIRELIEELNQKDKKIDELEKLVEQLRGEFGKEKKTICQLLSDGHAARLGADKRIDELERIISKKDKKIRELEKDPTDAELDIRAKEGARKHAEAKTKLQKMYDERPIISLVEGESIGGLLANECIRDLLVCM